MLPEDTYNDIVLIFTRTIDTIVSELLSSINDDNKPKAMEYRDKAPPPGTIWDIRRI